MKSIIISALSTVEDIAATIRHKLWSIHAKLPSAENVKVYSCGHVDAKSVIATEGMIVHIACGASTPMTAIGQTPLGKRVFGCRKCMAIVMLEALKTKCPKCEGEKIQEAQEVLDQNVESINKKRKTKKRKANDLH